MKGYKLWCIEEGSQKATISKDVTFNEDEMPPKKTTTHHLSKRKERTNIEVFGGASDSSMQTAVAHKFHFINKTNHKKEKFGARDF